jgi:subtilisin family serine protease
MLIRREWLEELIFRGEASRRFTQDSPVLPDVWLHYGEKIGQNRNYRLDLLLTPHRAATAGDLARAVRRRLLLDRPPKIRDAELAYSQVNVAVKLTLGELLRIVLPLSKWWRDSLPGDDDFVKLLKSRASRAALIAALRTVSADPEQQPPMRESRKTARRREPDEETHVVSADLAWMIRVVGTIVLATSAPSLKDDRRNKEQFARLSKDYPGLIKGVLSLVQRMPPMDVTRFESLLYAVTRNREVNPTIARSTMAVKADAARRVFEMDFRNLAWAILDTGIDARHPAFRKRRQADKAIIEPPFAYVERGNKIDWTNNTRVVRTFDFTRIRQILNPDVALEDRVRSTPQTLGAVPESTEKPSAKRPAVARSAETGVPSAESPEGPGQQLSAEQLEERAQQLTERLQRGRFIDWSELEDLLEVLHNDQAYRAPAAEHGTHVAGILAGDWRRADNPSFPLDEPEDLIGMCPTLSIYDFRVLDDRGLGDEFTVMAALQFIRYLNASRDQMVIHGANLSLSLRHDVANYACGRTPVCDECDRVVSSGVVVVAAAGNDGYMRFTTPSGESEGYRAISISDPGNAESVITVGSTHRFQPHTYGVSYFSSRGPTGDGRNKPDIVAPGEKITAPVPKDGARTKDGTSMAAPHVSGAAALLMARHRELIGRPLRVKQVLCSSATDLGRERYFQGSGMVDVLRALQSI